MFFTACLFFFVGTELKMERFFKIRSVLFQIIFKFTLRHQDLARLGAFLRTDHACVRELIHDAGSPVEADLEYTLQHSNRCFILFNDEFPGVGKEFIHIFTAAGCRGYLLYFFHLCLHVGAVGSVGILARQEINVIGNLFVGDKRYLHTCWFLIALRIKQHIALSEQLFCAVHIDDRPGVDARRNRKCDT